MCRFATVILSDPFPPGHCSDLRDSRKSLRSALNTYVPATVINTNERVSPAAAARPGRISSKQSSELTARNIEAPSADEKERLKFHSFTGSSFPRRQMIECLFWHVAVVNFVYEIYGVCWFARVYHTKHFLVGGGSDISSRFI